MHQGGDDLEDDFVIDDIVALSEDEAAPDGGFFSDSNDNDIVSADEDGQNGETQSTTNAGDAAALAKKRKRREKEKERKAKKRKLAEAVEVVQQSVAAQPPNELSDFLASKQAATFPKVTALELEDMRIPASSIADTTSWTGPRTLDQIVDFIIKTNPTLHKRLSQKSKRNGAPTLLFITGAALRVADVTRVLKDKRLRGEKGGEVAKLFAKHFKLAEHVAYLRRTKVGAAVGTPGRIGKLLCETDALAVSALSHIVLDVTYHDTKKRSLLDIPETRDEVFKTVLGGREVQKAIKEGQIQVVLF
ncbi:putative U3-containing 90S pre-ribosomal complex subunit [Lyophyllum shimeji]|uniref:U3-containing 90S pre-ribosomal complex subunit n=1 Tax=Lyophyllum shimeji TaxID=47721 RepID=A0A9P3PH09_LYOSH|nr:putative U3-containing 90S pre-ribosomal complex subunit [Lyophyllum shimeji]